MILLVITSLIWNNYVISGYTTLYILITQFHIMMYLAFVFFFLMDVFSDYHMWYVD